MFMPSSALNSHDPLSFSAKPQITVDSTKYTATKLQCIANYKLRLESSHEEPRLGRLLGHISIYDNVRAWCQEKARSTLVAAAPTPTPAPTVDAEPENELSTYLQHVPSFHDFQAAIEVQLATMAEVTAAAQQLTVEEYESDSDADSDYDSYDGESWSDDESDESLTDGELESSSGCTSPTSERGCDDDCDKNEEWTLQPLTPSLIANMVHF